MEYTYYPGCSLGTSVKANYESVRFVSKALGQNLAELENWSCCGAIHYMAAKETISFLTLPFTKDPGLALEGTPQQLGLKRNLIPFQLKEKSQESIR